MDEVFPLQAQYLETVQYASALAGEERKAFARSLEGCLGDVAYSPPSNPEQVRQLLQNLKKVVAPAWQEALDKGAPYATASGSLFMEQAEQARQTVTAEGRAVGEAYQREGLGAAAQRAIPLAIGGGIAAWIGLTSVRKAWTDIGEKKGFFGKTGQFLKALLYTGAVFTGGVLLVNGVKHLTGNYTGKVEQVQDEERGRVDAAKQRMLATPATPAVTPSPRPSPSPSDAPAPGPVPPPPGNRSGLDSMPLPSAPSRVIPPESSDGSTQLA